jgi:hypothetical protein
MDTTANTPLIADSGINYQTELSAADGSMSTSPHLEGTCARWLDKRFLITQRGSTIRTEIIAGVVNFVANS